MDSLDEVNCVDDSAVSLSSPSSPSTPSVTPISASAPVVIGISVDVDDGDSLGNHHHQRTTIPTVDTFIDRFYADDHSSSCVWNSPSSVTTDTESVQKKAFTKWLNSHLAKKGYPTIVDLYTDLRDGTILIALLDVLCDCKIKLERGRLRVHHLNNVARALQVLAERQVKLVNISTNDIVDGNPKLTLGLVWCMILHWQVNQIFRNSQIAKHLVSSSSNSATPDQLTTTGQQPSPYHHKPLVKSSSSSIPEPPVRGNSHHHQSNQSAPNSPLPSRIPISPHLTSCPLSPPPPPTLPKPKFGFVFPSGSKTNECTKLGSVVSTPVSAPQTSDHHHQSARSPALGTMSQSDLEKTLLAWCQAATKDYEGVQVKNFTTSWSDGLAINALIHHFRNKLLNYGEVLAMETPEARLQHAFDLASKHLGIEKLLDPEDMSTSRPDKKSVMMYIMCLFQVFDTASSTSSNPNPTTPSTTTLTTTTPPKATTSNIPSVKSPTPPTRPASIPKPSRSSLPTSKRPTPPSPSSSSGIPQSNIPVLSPDFQKRQHSNTPTSRRDSDGSKKARTESGIPVPTGLGGHSAPTAASSFDSEVLATYNSEIEDILTWLLGAEEHLSTSSEADVHRFAATRAAAAATSGATQSAQHEPEEYNRQRHKRIMSTIEAAEYAKQRVELHEDFMSNLTEYFEKISKTFQKGEKLIYGSESKLKSSASSGFGSSSSTASATTGSTFDMESKRVIALQMQLLDDRFNQLRFKAINHQQYLHQQLVETQNAQLEELRKLMTQTEERIAVIIPEHFDEMPVEMRSLESQLAEYEQLQEAMVAEQGLLNEISKFVVFEEHAGSKDGFMDQLEALNERWVNACRITEDRGKFLYGLRDNYAAFTAEETRLQDWFNRLERRLADMEESIDELEERPIRFDATLKEVKQEKKFLEDIKKRIDRMQIDIFYGTDQSQKHHAGGGNKNDDDDEDEPMTKSPLSKITNLTHTLLGKFGDKGMCLRIPRSIEKIRNRWDTLAGRIEHSQEVTKNRLEQLDLAMRQHPTQSEDEPDTAMTAVKLTTKRPPREVPTIKSNVSSIFAITTEESSTTSSVSSSAMKTTTVTKTTTEITTTETVPSTPETTKRRKVDFFGVVEWKNMLDSKIKWMDHVESTLLELSVAGHLFEGFGESDESETVEPVNFSTLSACLEQYDQLKENKTSIHQLVEQCFEAVSGGGSNDDSAIQAELEQLAHMDSEVAQQSNDFQGLVQKGEKIIADFQSANEEYESVQSVLEGLQKRWKTLEFVLDQCKLYSEVWYGLQQMNQESATMRHVLDKYQRRFRDTEKHLANLSKADAQVDALYKQIELCAISIQGQYSKIGEYNRKLAQYRLRAPMLFLCWPEEVDDQDFIWKRIPTDQLSTNNKISISAFQFSCFQQSNDLMLFNSVWSAMSSAGRFFLREIERIKTGESLDQSTGELELDTARSSLAKNKVSDWIEDQPGQKSPRAPSSSVSSLASLSSIQTSSSETPSEAQSETTANSPTGKLLVAIEALSSWLENVIDVIDEYDDDDEIEDEEGDEEAEGQQTAARTSKVPGAKLKSLADLANAIDNRVFVLVDMQKTVHAEQENYFYACRRAAQIIFDEPPNEEETEDALQDMDKLPQTERRLKGLDSIDHTVHSSLIEAIQMLIDRWHLVLDRFQTLLTQLEEISPATTLLEAEFAEISRWIEEAIRFLEEGIAIGDLATLGDQLAECERLKDYMERSVENTFQPILNNAKEAARILLGKSGNVEVPVVSNIETTWNNLSERTQIKLERLRHAQDFTRKLAKSLDEHQNWLRQFEMEILREGSKDIDRVKLSELYQEFKTDPSDESYDWRLAIPPKLQLIRLQKKRSEYLRAILEPPDSLLSQMQSFQTSGQSNLAFEKLKKQAKNKLVRAFDSLENKLKARIGLIEMHLSNLSKLIRLIHQETTFINQFEQVLTEVNTKARKSLETTEDAEHISLELQRNLSEAISGTRSGRLNQIHAQMGAESNLFEFLIQAGQQRIVQDQQRALEHILNSDSRLRSEAERLTESMNQFAIDWKESDALLCTLQKWLQDNQDTLESQELLNSKHQELLDIDKVYNKKFAPFKAAVKSLETRVDFIQQIFNEFTRKLNKTNGPPANTEAQLGQMEQFLADLGSAINEMEITFDDEDLQAAAAENHDADSELQSIPTLLQKIVDQVCADYETQLKDFHRQYLAMQSTLAGLPANDPSVGRLKKLDETHRALINALQYRRMLIVDLIDLCRQINAKLISLEHECSKVLSPTSEQNKAEPELAQIKQASNQLLSEVCQLKERLDIHCIRHSDILIGIEEVGARYDEIITEIAERYVDDEEEDEEEHGEHTENGHAEAPAVPEQIRYRPTNLVTPAAMAGHLSTICEEITTPIEQAKTPTTDSLRKSLHRQPTEAAAQEAEKPESLVKSATLIQTELVLVQGKIRSNPYTVKPYIHQLRSLERKINSICSGGRDKMLSISLVEDELHRLNKSLNKVRVPYELALCAASVAGLVSQTSVGAKAQEPEPQKLESEEPENSEERWDLHSLQLGRSLDGLKHEFTHSWITFLSLHRHWWLVRDATLQFNSEIRKLADWFENVELQLTNGRFTTVVVDESEPYGCFNFDVSDLNLPTIARTQRLLIAQLKSHVPIYAKLHVLYKRLVQCFTPNESSQPDVKSFEDRKALSDARNRIQHEMDQVNYRWSAIVRELTWRRECLVALATGHLVANVSGYPYKRGKDADFDKVLDDFLRYETSDPSSGWFQLEQLQQWQQNTEKSLEQIQSEFVISNIESACELFTRLKESQLELSRHYLNWMVVTQEPFIDNVTTVAVSKNHARSLSPEEREMLNSEFNNVSANLFQACYFTEVYMTCFAYITQLAKSELEWVITAHEHLNSIDDYLEIKKSSLDASLEGTSETPLEALSFVESLKNCLITHENNIEQIMTIVKELNQHASELKLRLDMSEFMVDFDRLSNLRHHLLARLRASGYTVWAALHHLVKQCFGRLRSFRQLRDTDLSSPLHPITGSLRTHPHHSSPRHRPDTGSASNSLHRQQAAQRQQSQLITDLRAYYHAALTQFNRWLALESFILSYYCALSLRKIDSGETSGAAADPSEVTAIKGQPSVAAVASAVGAANASSPTTTPVLQPSKVLKFTIRRCEDFLTEFNFAQTVLTQIWSELVAIPEPSQVPASPQPQSAPSSASIERKVRPKNEQSTSVKAPITVHRSHHQEQSTLVTDGPKTDLAAISNNQSHPIEPLNHSWYQTVQSEIMERIRDLQREHHKRSLAHLLNQSLQQNAQPQPPTNGGLASPTKSGKSQNLYDTVADALEQDGPPPPATPPYHRPFDEIGAAAAAATSPANLDSQRHEIDSWLLSMEKRFGDFVQEYNQAYLQRRKSSLTRNGPVSNTSLESLTSEASLKKQLTIISNYQSELNQYSAKLSNLSNSVDGRIASLVPNGSDVIKSNISMPYYDHLVELRKHADEMQIRINDLYLSIKCKLRSLQELFHYSTNSGSATNSASSRINLMSSGLVNGAGLDLGIDFHNTSSSASLKSKSSKQTQNASVQNAAIAAAARIAAASSSGSGGSGGDSGSGSTSSQVTAVAGSLTPTGYSLHEQSEKRFSKWLAEIEQSLQYIEKRLEAESALNQSGGKTEDGDDPLYSNVSEMQQMHMNYFEKIKIMQREIEQKRTDHRILMELLESESESDQTGSVQSGQSRGSQRDGSMGKRVIDPWLARFRSRVETLNTRWNSVRLRVLTVRSRLESNSIYATAMTTTVPQTPSSASLYSMNGYGTTTAVPPSRPPSSAAIMDETASSIAVTVAFNSAATERASQLLLSLRELVEWIIKRQTEYEAQQQTQQQAQLQAQATSQPNVPLDIANVLNQKSSLIQLRSQLGDKRPIIDSSLLACHNLLRRLAIKRSQDVQQSRLPSSVSIASSIAGSVATGVTGEYDPVRIEKIRAAKRQELAELEVTVSREMQRLLEIWNTLQVEVEMRLQRLDDAHLRLTDLQRAMEDLGAKLHEAEYTKAQWMPLGEIPYDQIPQQKALLKNYSQLYVTPIARDAVHVNELASRLTGRNVPLSHANLKSLEEATTRARLLQVAVDERARELEQAVHDHGTAQQHFLTEAVEAPWERAVTSNKLPCYINRTTESVHVVSPKYTEIMSTLSDFNRVRYAAYRTAMKLRSLQAKLGLDFVTLDILAEAFEQHGLGPNGVPKTKERQAQSNGGSGKGDQHPETSVTTSANLAEDINEDLPYELRLIAVPEIVSCLKMIFEMVAATAAVDSANSGSVDQGTSKRKKDKDKENKDKESSVASGSSTTAASVNVPLSVDLCLNWVLALYDAPSRSGYIRQFSFQVALVLLSKISLEQKYLYLFNLIADDNGRADERRLGLLIYDCLRLPKLLGEVAAFGGTNIEPSVRSCLEMAGKPPEGITAQQVLTWIQAEPQSLVWLLVLHRLRLADKSRHPAKCNLCRRYPIVGFRYRCLKCFNFDLCQECFLCDLASKKHKSSHPMQEYCVATTSGEDMRDFTRILRNKFKSGRYFKRHQALGYLPVQSLHEGDRIEESAPQFVHTLQGSYSHNPSSNTTPVHTLPYPARAASPGALTQRDLEFVLDNAGSRFQATVDRSMSSSSSMYGRTGPLGARRQTSVEHHYQSSPYSPIVQPKHSMQHASPFDRRLPQYHSTPVSPIHHNRSMDDEVHTRLGHYASRLAEAELVRAESLNRGSSTAPHRSLSQRSRQSRFDSLPGGGPNIAGSMGNGGPRHARTLPMNDAQLNHYDLVQSPTEMLSKIAADQRSELEQIIQRLEEENKMLVTEFDQLNDDDQPTGKTASKKEVSKKEPIAKLVDANLESEAVGEFSPLYENVIHSLERRQRERQEKEGKRPADPSSPVNGSNSRGDSLDSLDDSPASAATTATASMSNSGPIPAHLLEEARRLRENKSRLETRKTELEQCNQLLETQLTQFKAYISNSGALDAKTKKRLAKSIIEMEQMLDSSSTSSPGSPRTATTNGSNSPLRKQTGPNGVLESNKDSSLDSPASSSISQYHPSLLHNAADRVNNAVDNLVEAFTEGESGLNSPPAPQPTNGH